MTPRILAVQTTDTIYIYGILLNIPNRDCLRRWDNNIEAPSESGSISHADFVDLQCHWLIIRQLVVVFLRTSIGVFGVAAYFGDTVEIFLGASTVCLCTFTLAQEWSMSRVLASFVGADGGTRNRYHVTARRAAAIFTRPSVLIAIPFVLTLYSSAALVILISTSLARLHAPVCVIDASTDRRSSLPSPFAPDCRDQTTFLEAMTSFPMPLRITAATAVVLGGFFVTFNTYQLWTLLHSPAGLNLEAGIIRVLDPILPDGGALPAEEESFPTPVQPTSPTSDDVSD